MDSREDLIDLINKYGRLNIIDTLRDITEPCINDVLPNEIIQLILSYLPHNTVSLVNKLWYQLSKLNTTDWDSSYITNKDTNVLDFKDKRNIYFKTRNIRQIDSFLINLNKFNKLEKLYLYPYLGLKTNIKKCESNKYPLPKYTWLKLETLDTISKLNFSKVEILNLTYRFISYTSKTDKTDSISKYITRDNFPLLHTLIINNYNYYDTASNFNLYNILFEELITKSKEIKLKRFINLNFGTFIIYDIPKSLLVINFMGDIRVIDNIKNLFKFITHINVSKIHTIDIMLNKDNIAIYKKYIPFNKFINLKLINITLYDCFLYNLADEMLEILEIGIKVNYIRKSKRYEKNNHVNNYYKNNDIFLVTNFPKHKLKKIINYYYH